MRRWILLAGVVAVLACKKDTTTSPGTQSPPTLDLDPRNFPVGVASCGQGEGTLQVEVRSPNGRFPVPAAVVYVHEEDCGVTTDANGRAVLQGLTPGRKALTIQAGLFRSETSQNVSSGTTTASVNLAQGDVRLAVFAGMFDSVQNVLDSLGFTYDFYESADTLLNPDFFSRYDMIFINCGAHANRIYGETATYIQNIQNFVQGGGRLYVSDLAIPFFADMPFDSQIILWMEWGFDPPYGGQAGVYPARAVDSLLVHAVGLDTFRVELGGEWIMLDTTVAPGTHVLVEGPSSEDQGIFVVPYTEEFYYGKGKVYITSFHLAGSSPREVERFLQHLIFRF